MAIHQNFLAYQESLLQELTSTQDRVRHLIGSDHWQTDGEHKEASLRSVLRSRLPETVRIGRGFVCYPAEGDSSGQLDILITSKQQPTLYRDGELMFVTPQAVEAVAEVKTELEMRRNSRRSLNSALNLFADRVQSIRQRASQRCWAGLFAFECGNITADGLLRTLQNITDGNSDRVIDSIAVGGNLFVHFWDNGRVEVRGSTDEPVWHSYEIEKLAPAYFISNIVMHVSPYQPASDQLAWFPVAGGKETKRVSYATLRGSGVRRF